MLSLTIGFPSPDKSLDTTVHIFMLGIVCGKYPPDRSPGVKYLHSREYMYHKCIVCPQSTDTIAGVLKPLLLAGSRLSFLEEESHLSVSFGCDDENC